MGGSIRVIFKFKDTVLSQTRWTNSLPAFVHNPHFFECNENYIKEFWDKGWESPYMDPDSNISPAGYGIVIFDFDKKEIHEIQGYCNFNTIHHASISLEKRSVGGHSIVVGYEELWHKGHLLVYYYVSDEKYSGLSRREIGTFEEQYNEMDRTYLMRHKDPEKIKQGFSIDWSSTGWKLFDYPEDDEGLLAIFKWVKNNFKLTREELKGWVDHRNENFR